ncbi:T9SS type A sorting domain-containing protein [Hymenobacter sp. ASUV-10]|uniref:T9SS type A sorting domain-containing protein n=1 Tax=Hymenobacter aranciens TaxID=3063996 RepID=A0ABT9B790_9BACT|nr:T9SS type A sorting domain-containing protein [Hymenobacter sp. ASUV-10]MDO7874139.1 T9SS type A sorting domain-containing protein [Hymenobacter sp. ASUV-10]
MAVQPDGKVLVGGSLTTYNGVPVAPVVRLNANGTLDTSFQLTAADMAQGGTSPSIEVIVVQPDGKLVIGGSFSQLRGITVNNLARLHADGSTDASFNTGTGCNGPVRAVARQTNGMLLVGGQFTQFNATTTGSVVRLTASGAADPLFQPGTLSTGGIVMHLRVSPLDSILVVGRFTRYGGLVRGGIVRLSSSGIPDFNFGPGPGTAETVYDIIELPGSTYLAGGAFTSLHGVPRTGLARLNGSGGLDASYHPVYAKRGYFGTIVPQANGQLLAEADFDKLNGTPIAAGSVVRLNADGSLHSAIGISSSGSRYPQPDGSIMVLESYSSPQGLLQRHLPTGTLDPSFTPTVLITGFLTAPLSSQLLPAPNGRWLISGYFTEAGGLPRPGLARVLPSGAVDPSFVPATPWAGGSSYFIEMVAVQPDGKLLLRWSSNTSGFLARLNADGSLDTGFGTNGLITQPAAMWLTLLPSGQLLVSGSFTSFQGVAAPNGLVRLQANGTPDPSFTAALNGTITLQPDGRLLVTQLHPTLRLYQIKRLNADGSLDTSFATITTQAGYFAGTGVLSITVQPTDGKLLLAGSFVTVNGQQRVSLARLTNTLLAAQPALPAAPALDVYPNPAHHRAILRLPAAPAARPARLFDALGRPVRAFAVPAHAAETTVDLAGLPAGVYVLRCGAVSRRLVVE